MASPYIPESTDDTEMYEAEPDRMEEESEEELDIEAAIDNIDNHDNLTQLNILKKEINHLIIHNVLPSEGWYDERYKWIRTYSQLNWCELIEKFSGKDEYMCMTSLKILRTCEELLEECSTRANFHLPTYYKLIHEISNIWAYYHSKYIREEEDEDIIDLIEGLVHLMKNTNN